MVQKNSLRSLHCCLNSQRTSKIDINDNNILNFIFRYIYCKNVKSETSVFFGLFCGNSQYHPPLPPPTPNKQYWTQSLNYDRLMCLRTLCEVLLLSGCVSLSVKKIKKNSLSLKGVLLVISNFKSPSNDFPYYPWILVKHKSYLTISIFIIYYYYYYYYYYYLFYDSLCWWSFCASAGRKPYT